MTNAMIIQRKKAELAEQGRLKYTGRMITEIDIVTGAAVEVPEIQTIHTYAGWKERGYQVRKGQKSVACFPVWKYTKGKTKDMDEEEAQQRGYCFMKTASWFTDEQVDPIV